MGRDEAGSINRVKDRCHDTLHILLAATYNTPPNALALLPRKIVGTNLPTSRGWIAWLARSRIYVHNKVLEVF